MSVRSSESGFVRGESNLLICCDRCVCERSLRASQLFSLFTKLSVILSRFVLAVCEIGAELMSCLVFAIVLVGMGFGPSDCVGQAGEK